MTSYQVRRSGGGKRSLVPTEWVVENFKALEHVTMPMSGLVVLTGENSSGKSSLIQSLLMLAQSTDEEVILNGTLVRLGEPKDVIRSNCDSVSFSFTSQVHIRGFDEANEWSFEVSLVPSGSTLRVSEFHAAVDGEPMLSASAVRVTEATVETVDPDHQFGDSLLHVREIYGRAAPAKTYLSFRGFFPEAFILRQREEKVLASLRRTYGLRAMREDPNRAFQLYEFLYPWWRSNEESLTGIAPVAREFFERGSSPSRFVFETSREDLDALYKAYARSAAEEEWLALPVARFSNTARVGYAPRTTVGPAQEYNRAISGLAAAADSLRAIRDSVRYLGPLREEPQVVSATGGRNRSVPAGPRGEYTADLIARGESKVVQFFDSRRARRSLSLPDAVSLWSGYLGVGDAVAIEDQGKLGRGIRIKVNGVERDLTTVGVGASQVLPVLTVVLAADRNSVICLEQPELHLHPAVQSRLADFFLWARPDVRLIVETHSEYIINRLRLRAAESSITPSRIHIMFAEQRNGVTQIRRVPMNDLGELAEWPEGFFDASDIESRAIVRAVASKLRGSGE